MFIRVEPADFFMYRVKLVFDLENSNSEDQEVRDYLAEHELEPKYRSTGELEGSQCETMLFGGCYLGRHLDRIGQIQRNAVEVELLSAEVERHLAESGSEFLAMPGEQRRAAVAELVRNLRRESSFQTGENGELVAVLDGNAVREAAQQLANSLTRPSPEGQAETRSGVGVADAMERAMGIEPTYPAWKAGALAIVLRPHFASAAFEAGSKL